jgi:hypothetical protein
VKVVNGRILTDEGEEARYIRRWFLLEERPSRWMIDAWKKDRMLVYLGSVNGYKYLCLEPYVSRQIAGSSIELPKVLEGDDVNFPLRFHGSYPDARELARDQIPEKMDKRVPKRRYEIERKVWIPRPASAAVTPAYRRRGAITAIEPEIVREPRVFRGKETQETYIVSGRSQTKSKVQKILRARAITDSKQRQFARPVERAIARKNREREEARLAKENSVLLKERMHIAHIERFVDENGSLKRQKKG